MAIEEFERVFPAESDYVERKTGAGQTPISRAITALSNTDGGVILVGVDDQGTIRGRPLTDGLENAIHGAALTVHDPGRYWIRELLVGGTPVTVVSVAGRAQGFAQTSDGQVLVRRAARSVPLVGADLLSVVTSRALQRFDSTDAGVSLELAVEGLIEEVRTAFRWRRDRVIERLVETKLATEQEEPHLTIAGALLMLGHPQDQLGKAHVEVLRYPDEGQEYDRRVEFSGPVQHQIADTTEFVMRNLGPPSSSPACGVYELPKIPEVVLREAIANAVAHRTYEDVGRATRIELRPDRVVVVSPRGLPEPVTEENIREAQSARNITVIRVLRQLALAEDAGRGIDVMQDSMPEAPLDPLLFHDLGHAVEVTLPIHGPISPQERAWVFEVESHGGLEPLDRIPLIHAARGEVLTNARVRELLGVDSREAARASLHRLRDAGFLEQQGERGGASYILSPSIRAPAAFRMSPSALRDFVLGMADEGPADECPGAGDDRLG